MKSFAIVWAGQLVSLMGSTMTGVALSLWAWQETGTSTALALVAFASFAPTLLVSPFAGVVIDRWPRKWVLILADMGSSASATVILVLHVSGGLELWHLYLLSVWGGVCGAFHEPAFAAAISTMIPKQHYARANGMLSLAQAAATVTAPALAGVLLGVIGLEGMLLLDLITFGVAAATLLVITTPPPSHNGASAKEGLWRASCYGFRYVAQRPALLALLLFYVAINFIGAFSTVLLAPMVLARSGGDELALGTVLSALGAGGLVGGLVMSVWGGFRRRIHGVLLGLVALSLFGYGLLGVGQTLTLWLVGAFALTFFVPLLSASHIAIWQAKVPPEVQGRVFATKNLVGQLAVPMVMLGAAPLADLVLEPAMQPGGLLASTFGGWVGTGPGAGMALLFVFAASAGVLLGVTGVLLPAIRQVETRLPEHDNAVRLAD